MAARKLFRVEGLPVLQNRVYPTAEAARASPVGDVVLCQDERSGLVSNHAFDASKLVYDADYQNEQAISAAFRRHLDEVMQIVDRRLHGASLIEVGCGKGYFLQRLLDAGYDATGIDPAYEGNGEHVVRALFEPGLGISADAIVLRHVLEHVERPVDFLAAITRANGGRGLIYIEVPCFDWICRHRAWFDVYYEHVNYFRLSDFSRMFGNVIEAGHVFGGQYLYVVADIATLREPVALATDAFDFPEDFDAGIAASLRRVASFPNALASIWGASSKGVIFSNHLRRAGVDLDTAIDINPAKQGRFIAATALRIVSPDEALRTLPAGAPVFVMNPNYHDEIAAKTGDAFQLLKVDNP